MSVRVGVDVGGTFTKAVACDPVSGEVVARSVVPTTHASVSSVAEGAVKAISSVAEDVAVLERGPIELIAHSTTQAVNALLEGDTAIVGVLGMGRRPDLKRAHKRTAVGDIRLAPGRNLVTRHSFLDVTDGIEEVAVRRALHGLVEDGAEVVTVSEAFGVEDPRGEWLALKIAEEMGVPASAGHELSGLYGLEMRTVTAALNASILPAAVRTAHMVEEAAERNLAELPLLVMRGDGGVVSLDVMKRQPLLTAFSGPAASVAGALRQVDVHDAVAIEVGGTSTNVATIKAGRSVLSYVRVLDHVTCVRSLDVRVVGVAGGSLIRVGRRFGRPRVADVGPRSAHIAGLPYACFVSEDELAGATPQLIAPRPGDPPEYLVLETSQGRRVGVTLTCAANALGEVASGSYALGNAAAARRAFELAAPFLGVNWRTLAGTVLGEAAGKIADVVAEAVGEQELEAPLIVGLGGGAGAVIPTLARKVGAMWEIPSDAEVISSIGDAQSVVRVEVERTLSRPTAHDIARVHREAEAAALRAGAASGTIQVESQAVPERSALRVTAYGAVALETTAALPVDAGRVERAARNALNCDPELIFSNEFYSVYCSPIGDDRDFVVVDRHGAVGAQGVGRLVTGVGAEVAASLMEKIPALVRHYGPIAVAPAVRLLRGARLIDLTLISNPEAAREAVLVECALAHDEPVVAFVCRS